MEKPVEESEDSYESSGDNEYDLEDEFIAEDSESEGYGFEEDSEGDYVFEDEEDDTTSSTGELEEEDLEVTTPQKPETGSEALIKSQIEVPTGPRRSGRNRKRVERFVDTLYEKDEAPGTYDPNASKMVEEQLDALFLDELGTLDSDEELWRPRDEVSFEASSEEKPKMTSSEEKPEPKASNE